MSAAQEKLIAMVRALRDDDQAKRAYDALIKWFVQDEIEQGQKR
jgi:hypothetical protein